MRMLLATLALLPAAALAGDKAGKLSGTWENGDWALTVMDDHVVPVHKPTGIAGAVVTMRVSGDTIVIEDTEGPMACDAGKARYRYKVKDEGLTFEALSDECKSRKDTVTAGTWTRVEMPETS